MIDRKYQTLVFAFFMALLMSCLMSFAINAFNVGLTGHWLQRWLKAWSFAFVIAFPTVTLVSPLVRKLVAVVVKP